MGRGLDRKKRREQAKRERKHRTQEHHERKRRKAEPSAPVPQSITAVAKIVKPERQVVPRKAKMADAPAKKARVIDPTTAAALAREEEEIKMLEKKLGLKGKRTLSKAFDDGLDYLLGWKDDVDEIQSSSGVPSSMKRSAAESQDQSEEDGGSEAAESGSEDVEREEGEEELDGELSNAFDDDAVAGEDGEVRSADNDADEEENDGNDDEEQAEHASAPKPTNADRSSKPGKYVPPALRKASDTEAIVSRRVRSALNKLSPGNVQVIFSEIEDVFSTAPRAEVTAALSQGIVANAAAAFGRAQIAARAALLAALGASIGGDVVGVVLTAAVQRLEELLVAPPPVTSAPSLTVSHEDTSLLSLLTALLGLGVVAPRLMFELANRLCQDFSESRVELLYQLLQQCGFVLRDADASALRSLIAAVQQHAASLSGAAAEGRVKFLLESLTNLRHNKRSLHSDDALEPLKKWLRQRPRKCEVQEGGWNDWLEGGAAKRWVSGPGGKSVSTGTEEEEPQVKQKAQHEAALEALARKERMNTPGRRAVFCVLMGAEDFADAVEKLSRMGEGRAERDVGAVLLHCAAREAKFNPFYAHVAARLCALRHSYRVTFQFAFWDKIKEADSMRLPELANLAKLLGHLAGLFALSLSVLRVIDFEPLSARHLLFLRLALVHLFTAFNEATILSAMRRLSSAPRTEDLREGLQVLLEQGIDTANLSEAEGVKVKRGTRIARKVLEEAAQADAGEPEDAAEEEEEDEGEK